MLIKKQKVSKMQSKKQIEDDLFKLAYNKKHNITAKSVQKGNWGCS